MAAKVTSLAITTGVAGTTFDVTLGFQPVAVILILVRDSATDTVGRLSVPHCVGFGTSSSDRRCTFYLSADAQGNGSLFIRQSATSIMTVHTTLGAGELDIDAEANWPADGIRFIVDTQFGNAMRCMVIGIDGTDMTEPKTLSFQEAATTVAHGLGGTPVGVLFASVGFATAPASESSAQGMFMFGGSDGVRNAVSFVGGDDGNTTMDTRSYSKTGECIALGPEPAVTTDARAAVTSFDATNINLSWTESASTRYIFGLVWRGGQFRIDSGTTRTDTTGFSGPTNGFVATLAMFSSACRGESTADTPTDHAQWSVGAATSASERMAYGTLDEDAVATSETSAAVEYDEVYANIDTASAIQGLMDVTDLTVDPMQLVMDDADPAESFFWTASWGAAAGAGTPVRVRTMPTLGVGRA